MNVPSRIFTNKPPARYHSVLPFFLAFAALTIGPGGAMAQSAAPPNPMPDAAGSPSADPSNADLIDAARRSPLLRQTLQVDDLRSAGLQTVRVLPGVEMDFQRYVAETRLPKQPQLAELFDAKKMKGILSGQPTYREEILAYEDRLIIDRRLTVPMAAGACTVQNPSENMGHLCFTKKSKNLDDGITAPVAKDLAQIRSALATRPGSTVVRDGITAAQALAMNDEQLLELVLNSNQRTIHHISIVPRQPLDEAAHKAGSLKQFENRLAPRSVSTGLSKETDELPANSQGGGVGSKLQAMPTKYFLTGFTYGKQIDDSWEYTFVEGSWWHDRYYVRVNYQVGMGFGLRAPFSIKVKAGSADGGPPGHAGIGASTRNVEVAVAPVNVDVDGRPAFQAVGLPGNKTFRGNEFVLELKAGCKVSLSIPGPNVSNRCPSIDLDYSRSVDPVIGGGVSIIDDWWLNGSKTGLGVDIGVASASLDIGLGADVRNGRIAMRSRALNGSKISAGGTGNLKFASTKPLAFTVASLGGPVSGGGFRLDRPTYKFDIRATPQLRARIGVDVACYENEWTLGPYALDFMAIDANFVLSHHKGTVSRHDFWVIPNLAPPASLP